MVVRFINVLQTVLVNLRCIVYTHWLVWTESLQTSSCIMASSVCLSMARLYLYYHCSHVGPCHIARNRSLVSYGQWTPLGEVCSSPW